MKKFNNNKSILFWITGLSGSGKTVIAEKIKHKIAHKYGPTLTISGDDLRKIFDFNKFSKRTALISENLEKLSYSGLISRADKIGSQVTKKSLVFILCENNIDSIVAYVGFIRSRNTVCLLDQNIKAFTLIIAVWAFYIPHFF